MKAEKKQQVFEHDEMAKVQLSSGNQKTYFFKKTKFKYGTAQGSAEMKNAQVSLAMYTVVSKVGTRKGWFNNCQSSQPCSTSFAQGKRKFVRTKIYDHIVNEGQLKAHEMISARTFSQPKLANTTKF